MKLHLHSAVCAFFASIIFLATQAQATWLSPEAPDEEHWRDRTFEYRAEDPDDSVGFSVPKTVGVASLTLVAYGAAYWLVFAKGWWDESGSHFHFENDFEYAKNLDKFGHFASGVALGEFFYEGYHWAGVPEFYSYLAAGGSTFLTHVAIDVKDGFSPEWGFSVFDVLSGTLGGFYPMAKRYVPFFKYIDLKWSYWINSQDYYDNSDTGVFTDDYVNQTYWCSFKVYRFLPNGARKYYPEWLAVALGLSIDGAVFRENAGKGRYEIFLALDYDLEAFRPHSHLARTIIKALNYIKFPAPTLQLHPDVEVHWLYPIKF